MLVLAAGAAVGCVLSWLAAVTTVVVAPVLENEPLTTSARYSAPLVALSLLLASAAGVLAVLAFSSLRAAAVRRRAGAHRTHEAARGG